MYGYIYKTTNKTTGQIYVGKKKSHPVTGTHPNYYGSGKLIKEDIGKFGKDNFKVDIIEWCKDKEKHSERERFWIGELNSLYIYGNYNMALGGIGGGAVGQANNFSATNYDARGKNNPFYGKQHTIKTKRMISETKKGSTPPNKGRMYTEEEKEKWYYNKTFSIVCSVCGFIFTSHASGTRYCTTCKTKRDIARELEGIISILNGECKAKPAYVTKRVEKILKMQVNLK